jgi:hypothetical protein
VVDLFAKASEGRSSGDSPCARSLVVSDAETGLIDVEIESEPLCDTAAPIVTVHDLTEIKADDSTITDSNTENCDMPIPESVTATCSSESLSGPVTPAPNVVSKAPTKRARASKAKAVPVPAPTKRQKAMASTASALASARASVGAEKLQQDGEAADMQVEESSISDTGAEQSVETSVSAAITEESSSEMCVEEPKATEAEAEAVAVADVGLKKRKRTATISANTSKKEEIVLSAEVLKKIECITARISLNLGELAALER